MNWKKPSNKNIPKTEYKKNNLADMAGMAQGIIPMLPKKAKLMIGGAIALLVVGAGTTLYGVVELLKYLTTFIPN